MDDQIDLALDHADINGETSNSKEAIPDALQRKEVLPLVDFDMPEAGSVLGPVMFRDPTVCHPFAGAPRAGYPYDERRDADLAADITAHGIIDPLILMRMEGRTMILSGNRRHAIVMHLRSRGIEVRLPVRIADFKQLEAVAFATACNTGRAAPTAMELARSVKWTLENVEKSQAAVARALAMDQAKVSHLCVLASLPDWLTEIVTDPEALSENFAAMIGPGLADAEQQQVMKDRAQELAAANVTLAGPAAARYLRTGQRSAAVSEIRDAQGAVFGSVKRDPRGGILVRLSPKWQKVGGGPAATVTLVTEVLASAMHGDT